MKQIDVQTSSKKLLRVLHGDQFDVPPIWMMRQAGRYLPEYRAIRSTAPSFLDFCYSPNLATEATLQPINRFGFDAAILFSDILVIPDALGQKVSFETGEGPRLDPITDERDLNQLRETLDFEKLDAVFETIIRVKSKLPEHVTFLGFCGAPWTVASYMIAGRGTPDQAPARLFAYRNPDLFQKLIDHLVDVSVDYLEKQFQAGVDAVQIFDSWCGVLPAAEFERWCLRPVSQIIQRLRLRVPNAPIIAFPRNAGSHLISFQQTSGANAIGISTCIDTSWIASSFSRDVVVQGNLDPLALIAGGHALASEVARIKKDLAGRPYIFNLGHGILPETPIENVELLLKLVREGL